MSKKLLVLVLVLSVGINAAFATLCALQRFSPPPHVRREDADEGERPEIWCPLHRKLGVTEEQWKEIEPEMRRFHRQVRGQSKKVRKLREGMFEIIRAPEVDRQRMEAQQEKIIGEMRRMQDIVLEHLLVEKRLLTDAQEDRLFRMLRRAGPPGPPHMLAPGQSPSGPADPPGDQK